MDGQDGVTARHNNIISRSSKTGQSRRTNRTCNNGKRKESIGKNRKADIKNNNNIRHASVSPQNRNIKSLNLQNINDPNLVNNDTLMSPINNSNTFSKDGKTAILFQDDDSDNDNENSRPKEPSF